MNDRTKKNPLLSIVIPAKNEANSLPDLLQKIRAQFPNAETIVVDDGSDDGTANVAREKGATVVVHPYSLGNGGAVKSGVRAAHAPVVILMDGDGQHRPEDISNLLAKLESGYDMVIGARNATGHASLFRRLANWIYNRLASLIVGHPIHDLTSGMRAVRKNLFDQILPLLPNGFSYPTTSTMAFFRLGYRVGYEPITVLKRQGESHIKVLQDGFRFLLIIIKIGTLYSPLKLFVPLSAGTFAAGAMYYAYTYFLEGRFTNMAALLFSASIFIFLFGLLSEQITTLLYSQTSNRRDDE